MRKLNGLVTLHLALPLPVFAFESPSNNCTAWLLSYVNEIFLFWTKCSLGANKLPTVVTINAFAYRAYTIVSRSFHAVTKAVDSILLRTRAEPLYNSTDLTVLYKWYRSSDILPMLSIRSRNKQAIWIPADSNERENVNNHLTAIRNFLTVKSVDAKSRDKSYRNNRLYSIVINIITTTFVA
jgi:hypothetical protein